MRETKEMEIILPDPIDPPGSLTFNPAFLHENPSSLILSIPANDPSSIFYHVSGNVYRIDFTKTTASFIRFRLETLIPIWNHELDFTSGTVNWCWHTATFSVDRVSGVPFYVDNYSTPEGSAYRRHVADSSNGKFTQVGPGNIFNIFVNKSFVGETVDVVLRLSGGKTAGQTEGTKCANTTPALINQSINIVNNVFIKPRLIVFPVF